MCDLQNAISRLKSKSTTFTPTDCSLAVLGDHAQVCMKNGFGSEDTKKSLTLLAKNGFSPIKSMDSASTKMIAEKQLGCIALKGSDIIGMDPNTTWRKFPGFGSAFVPLKQSTRLVIASALHAKATAISKKNRAKKAKVAAENVEAVPEEYEEEVEVEEIAFEEAAEVPVAPAVPAPVAATRTTATPKSAPAVPRAASTTAAVRTAPAPVRTAPAPVRTAAAPVRTVAVARPVTTVPAAKKVTIVKKK